MANETRLTKEQIEAAAQRIYDAHRQIALDRFRTKWLRWEHIDTTEQDEWRDAAVAAAPHLQYPIAPVTRGESAQMFSRYMRGGCTDACSFHNALADFVDARNAALAPKPTKREEIARVLGYYLHSSEAEHVADRIEALYSEGK